MPDMGVCAYLSQSQTTRRSATSPAPSRNLKRKKPVYAESSSDDDTPLASSPAKPAKANGSAKVKHEESASDNTYESEDDAPKKTKPANGRSVKPPRKKVKEESDSSDDDKPLESAKRPAPRKRKPKSEDNSDAEVPPKKKAPRRKKVKDEEAASETETPKPKKRGKAKKEKEETKSPKGKGKKKEKEEEQEEVFRWWENQDPNGDGSSKWMTLEHHGVIFPPPYEPLPKNVKMKYKGPYTLCICCAICLITAV